LGAVHHTPKSADGKICIGLNRNHAVMDVASAAAAHTAAAVITQKMTVLLELPCVTSDA